MSMARGSLKIVSLAMIVSFPAAWAGTLREQSPANPLQSVARICVGEIVGMEPLSLQTREMIVAALFKTGRFRITEDCARADAVLKGGVVESSDRRVRAESEDTDFGTIVGSAHANRRSGSAHVAGAGGGSGESLLSAETVTNASLSLRIMDGAGDVIWAHTEESGQGKSRSAVALAVQRTVQRLMRDIEGREP